MANLFNVGKCKAMHFGRANLNNDYYRVGQKNGLFLTVDNFATVSGRKACDMSKVY